MTDTELSVIAALAIIGLSSSPHTGYSTPAAIGHPEDIIEEREEQILPDVAHGALAQTPRPDNTPEIPLHQGHARALHRHIGPGSHCDADLRLRQGGRVVDPSPAMATTWPSACRRWTTSPFLLGEDLGLDALDAERARHRFCRGPAIAREHDDLHAVRTQAAAWPQASRT